MSIAILHLSGDGNVPPVRVPSTVALAREVRSATVYTAVDGPEAFALWGHFGPERHEAHEGARDTVDEITITMPAIRADGARTLYLSTEPGHLFWRATLAARILYLGRGVRIVPWPSAPGKYRSPWYDTVRTIVKAVRRRVLG